MKEKMKIQISFTENDLNCIREKFNIENEDDLYNAVLEMISTYLEM